jgi:hypothetical protein
MPTNATNSCVGRRVIMTSRAADLVGCEKPG